MKLRRLSDKLVLCNWIIAIIILFLGIINISSNSPLKIVTIQIVLLSVQFISIMFISKAFDKRHSFSCNVADKIYECLNKNVIPTVKAIEDYKQQLRKEYVR